MNDVRLYIDGTQADLYNDETIQLEVIGKKPDDFTVSFGEYSQAFSLPASKSNNAIFKHFYNRSVLGFDALQKVAAFIEVDGYLIANGYILLEGVETNTGQPVSYKVTFYGSLLNLKELFGEDKLADLSHGTLAWSRANIKTGLSTTYPSDSSVIIPYIVNKAVNYDSVDDTVADNVAFVNASQTGYIDALDLRPAKSISSIIDTIATDYGLSITQPSIAGWDDLYMWLSNTRRDNEGDPTTQSGYIFDPVAPNFTTYTGGTWTDYDLTTDTYTVPVAQNGQSHDFTAAFNFTTASNLPRRVVIEIDGIEVYSASAALANWSITYSAGALSTGQEVQLKVQEPNGEAMDAISMTFGCTTTITVFAVSLFNQTINSVFNLSEAMPDMKVIDFLSGIMKLHNLQITATGTTSFKMETLETFYSNGATIDITDTADVSNVTVGKMPLYNTIVFKSQESDLAVAKKYRELNAGRSYGDIDVAFTFTGSEFNLEIPFEIAVSERLTDAATQELVDFTIIQSIDEEGDEVIPNAMLFYAKALTPSSTLGVFTGTNTESVGTLWNVSSSDGNTQGTTTSSLVFDPDTLDTLYIDTQPSSVYNLYYKDYLTDLYDTSGRRVTLDAYLSLGQLLQVKGNTKVTIGQERYVVERASLDMRTGKTKLTLITVNANDFY